MQKMKSRESEGEELAARVQDLLERESRGEASDQERAELHILLIRKWRETTSLAEIEAAIVKWREAKGFETTWLNVPEKLMLIVTELSEAMEAYRHIDPDVLAAKQNSVCGMGGAWGGYFCYEDVPDAVRIKSELWLKNFAEELSDTFVRLADLTGSLGIDLQLEVARKMAVNELRPHKHGKEC
jgi:NTP pyrophosphatase (non-canonical NTP hydrolase)